MSELQNKQQAQYQVAKTPPKRQLFNYYIQQNIYRDKNESRFFYRVNRWRFNSADFSNPQKIIRVRNPLLLAGVLILAYDWTYGWDFLPPEH